MVDFSKLASNNPENMVAGGLQDDFDGVIVKARYCPWNYGGKRDVWTLAVRLDIRVDGETDTFDQFVSAGDLEQFMPSNDGENPVNTDGFGQPGFDMTTVEGIYAIRVGKKEGLSNNSNWAQFVGAALEANFPKDKLSPDVRFVEGVHAHFNRIPQKKRAGLVKAQAPGKEGERAKTYEVLVITEFKGFVDVNAKIGVGAGTAASNPFAKPAPSTSPAPSTFSGSTPSNTAPTTTTPPSSMTATGGGDLDSKLAAIVVNALKSAPEGLSKSKLPPLALQGLTGAEKGKGVARIVAVDFLAAEGRPWAFDPEGGMLYAI